MKILDGVHEELIHRGELLTGSAMQDFKFDKNFTDKLRRLFEERFIQIQSDASLKTAKLMYKDVKF